MASLGVTRRSALPRRGLTLWPSVTRFAQGASAQEDIGMMLARVGGGWLSGLLVAACACSGMDNVAGAEMPGPTAAAPARVRVLRGDAPAAGEMVVFHRRDGSVDAVLRTDADGVAEASLDAGAMVTASWRV